MLCGQRVGVLGGSSPVGQMVLSRLSATGALVTAYTRGALPSDGDRTAWKPIEQLFTSAAIGPEDAIPLWISVAPIWVLLEHLENMRKRGARHIVALSSTSRYTKHTSSDPQERLGASRWADAEEQLQVWGAKQQVSWTVLRPTLIYGGGRDKNVAAMAAVIRRIGIFPLLGAARGLRQPIHADDVAAACVAALSCTAALDRAYNLSGGEILAYREMAVRVFDAVGRLPRFLPVPLWLFRVAVGLARWLPRFHHLSPAMAERMNLDLVFDNTDARHDLDWEPRPFCPGPQDVGGPS